MSEQLALDLELREDTTFSNFYPGRNQEILTVLQEIARGRGESFVYLWGNKGVGRTHLLQACCHVADQLKLSPIYIPLVHIDQLTPEIFENLESLHLICIDDVDCIAGRPAWEEAFFHFYNHLREAGKRLVVTGNVPPRELGLALQDLVSRLSWGLTYQIHPLTDIEKLHALLLKANARGLDLPEKVAEFLIKRWPRDIGSLFDALDRLDHASLQAKKKLSVPFVKSVLEI